MMMKQMERSTHNLYILRLLRFSAIFILYIPSSRGFINNIPQPISYHQLIRFSISSRSNCLNLKLLLRLLGSSNKAACSRFSKGCDSIVKSIITANISVLFSAVAVLRATRLSGRRILPTSLLATVWVYFVWALEESKHHCHYLYQVQG